MMRTETEEQGSDMYLSAQALLHCFTASCSADMPTCRYTDMILAHARGEKTPTTARRIRGTTIYGHEGSPRHRPLNLESRNRRTGPENFAAGE